MKILRKTPEISWLSPYIVPFAVLQVVKVEYFSFFPDSHEILSRIRVMFSPHKILCVSRSIREPRVILANAIVYVYMCVYACV